jgi:hypothetical protein
VQAPRLQALRLQALASALPAPVGAASGPYRGDSAGGHPSLTLSRYSGLSEE